MSDQVEVDPERLAASATAFDAKADECEKLATRFADLLGPVASGTDPDLAILMNQVVGPAAQVESALEGIAQYIRGTGEGLRVAAQLYSGTDAANVDRARQTEASAAAIDGGTSAGGTG